MSEIVKKEIRYAFHLAANESINRPDLHFVKEVTTDKEGNRKSRCFYTENYQRQFWVTVPNKRNHKEKKEFEHKEFLNAYKTTQSEINRSVARALDLAYLANSPDKLKASPYLYGYDVKSTGLIKLASLKKNDFVQSAYTVGAADIETKVDTKEILMKTFVVNGEIHTAVMRSFLKGVSDPVLRVKNAIEHYIPEYKDWKLNLTVHDDVIDLLKHIFKVANVVAPDFLAYWNIQFDLDVIFECLKERQVNPIDVIPDQSLPRNYRTCRFIEGPRKKVTSSGVVKPINPSLRWHKVVSTSNFHFIDAMCVYRQLRLAEPEEPSYSLDSILTKHLKKGKLKFTEADAYKADKWHTFMQENYPIEYIVYNIYDCIGMLELDAKTNDLSRSLPSFSGMTDFNDFNSQVKKVSDAIFLFGLDNNMVIGTVGGVEKKSDEETELPDDDEEDEDDEYDVSKHKALGLKGWIQLLRQDLLYKDGLKCLSDFPDVKTNIRGMNSDLDSVSSYPTCSITANVSKATTKTEVISMGNIPERVFKEQNLSICLGASNMLEYNSVMFGMPNLLEINLDDI